MVRRVHVMPAVAQIGWGTPFYAAVLSTKARGFKPHAVLSTETPVYTRHNL